jgi:hypothetical protein
MKKILYLIISSFLLLSCAGTAPQRYSFDNYEVYEGTFDKVWSAVIETFAEKNISISNMEKVSGFISTQEMRFPPRYADCGKTPIGIEFNSDGPLGTFNAFVKEISPGKYNISINASFRLITTNMFYQGCTSTGTIESILLVSIRDKLGYPNPNQKK